MCTFVPEMKKCFSDIKEFLQYIGIICLSLLSALWLTIIGQRHQK